MRWNSVIVDSIWKYMQDHFLTLCCRNVIRNLVNHSIEGWIIGKQFVEQMTYDGLPGEFERRLSSRIGIKQMLRLAIKNNDGIG